jgi:hypothetical protein
MPNRRAVCIGIDDYPGPESLNGCVNDAQAWSEVLQDLFEFPEGDVKLLLNKSATRNNIISAIQTLFSDLNDGDMVVLTVSCHGSYLTNDSGIGFKEVLCPYDVETARIEVAELAQLTYSVPMGVRLTLVLDTGFTGTTTHGAISESFTGLRFPDDRRVRFLSPALMGKQIIQNPWSAKADKTDWNALVFMASSAYQYAFEAYIDGEYHGAFSYSAIRTIRAAGGELGAQLLKKQTTLWLDDNAFAQCPQLIGKLPKGRKRLFG